MLIYCPQAAADSGRVHARIILTGPSLPSRVTSQLFFSLYDDRSRKWQCGGRVVRVADLTVTRVCRPQKKLRNPGEETFTKPNCSPPRRRTADSDSHDRQQRPQQHDHLQRPPVHHLRNEVTGRSEHRDRQSGTWSLPTLGIDYNLLVLNGELQSSFASCPNSLRFS